MLVLTLINRSTDSKQSFGLNPRSCLTIISFELQLLEYGIRDTFKMFWIVVESRVSYNREEAMMTKWAAAAAYMIIHARTSASLDNDSRPFRLG